MACLVQTLLRSPLIDGVAARQVAYVNTSGFVAPASKR